MTPKAVGERQRGKGRSEQNLLVVGRAASRRLEPVDGCTIDHWSEFRFDGLQQRGRTRDAVADGGVSESGEVHGILAPGRRSDRLREIQ